MSNVIYELPFRRGDSWLERLAGNWVVSGIYQAQSGFPISIFANGVDGQGTGFSARASFCNTRSDRLSSTQTPGNTRNYTGPDRTLFTGDPVCRQ